MKKPKMKVVIAGLDYAGKTSLINRLINDYNYEDMINLEPTVGANIEEYQSEKVDLILWDLGGQRDHLNEYLSFPEQFFVQVDVLIYVFDSQDDLRYLEAIKYLNDIINILTFLNENPYILILLNKADSDIMNDPDYQIKIEYLTDKITEIFKNSEKSWTFEIIPTSIYNFYSKEPEIARSIKNIFSYKEKDEVKLLPEIDEKIRRILDINLKLMDKVVSELAEIKRILFRLNPLDFSVEGFSIPFEKVPIDYITIEDQNLAKTKKKKSKEKLKELSRAKFLKKKAGPPKQRPSFLSIEKEEKEKQKAGKITEETLKETLSSLKRV
ncbi:MAG: ADP-ribosylation factor-like protein [Promethearchaeota archaeon]